ncbi:MAG: HAD-IC family P-type ATPase [Firmicutes bacterium]|nr:HAD-IC family P-type ATPase [Bacillota bacterium]
MELKKHIEKLTNIETGLSLTQANENPKNIVEKVAGKTNKKIYQEHIVTLFNMINVFLAILVILTGSLRNMTFMGVVIINAAVGIYQEIRSKKVLDNLALLNQPKVKVLRESQELEISVEDIVENDIYILKTGDQVCVDGICVDGRIECNESMLTGESDLVTKEKGNSVFSGSIVVSGQAKIQVLCVGKDTYAYSILERAKREKRYPSKLRDSIQAIIRFCTFVLIPAGALLFLKSFLENPAAWKQAILSMVAAVVGMIPEGLVFLTSVALAIGAQKLARQKVLIQELYCIETLARVDVFCVDKTGTLTKGQMSVEKIVPKSRSVEEIKDVLSSFYNAIKDENDTARAIRNYVGKKEKKALSTIPFSSTRKASAVQFEDGWIVLGAYPFLVENPNPSLVEEIKGYAQEGYRVLTVGSVKEVIDENLKGNPDILGFVLIRDVLRDHIHEIMNYFYEQSVDIKVISGDDCQTVAAIARQAGIRGEAIDMSGVSDVDDVIKKYSVFGRVTPEQKREMVLALKKRGHTVAMTGDGVNDVMALKEADCSIAMGSGSQATKSIASIVLLENQFEAMPHILRQGRYIINNIQRTASLFLVKTLFSFGLTLLTLALLSAYPFKPIQLTLISSLATGFPSFVLTLEPDDRPVSKDFLLYVFTRALPGALCVITSVVGVTIFSNFIGMSQDQFSTICTYLAGWNALCVLISVCVPMTNLRKILVSGMIIAFIAAVCLFPGIFYLVPLRGIHWFYLIGHIIAIPVFLYLMGKLTVYAHKRITENLS